MKHFISINDLTPKEIFETILPGTEVMVEAAKKLQQGQQRIIFHPWQKATLFFGEPSTRTLGSYEEAARLLGWERMIINGEEATSLAKKESLANTARMLAGQGADVLVIRNKIEGAPKFIAEILDQENYPISVQNGGDGTNQHPTQTFLDLLTIKLELGRTEDFKIGLFGDLKYGRTVHSLLCALAHRKNISARLASIPETALPDQYKDLFSDITEGDSLQVLEGCDIIYGTRLQKERAELDPIAFKRVEERFRMTKEILESLGSVIVMHPLPYVTEFAPGIIHDERLAIFRQAWNGIPTRMFLLNHGYRNKHAHDSPEDGTTGLIKIIQEITLSEYLKKRGGRKRDDQYFLPVRSGTVIDHIAEGMGGKIKSFLTAKGVLSGGVKHIIEDVPSSKHGFKDVLVLEMIFLEKKIIEAVAAISPGVTINEMREGVFRKMQVQPPAIVAGIGHCPNKNCITNHDPEADSKFRQKGGVISCFYCEKQFTRKEIL